MSETKDKIVWHIDDTPLSAPDLIMANTLATELIKLAAEKQNFLKRTQTNLRLVQSMPESKKVNFKNAVKEIIACQNVGLSNQASSVAHRFLESKYQAKDPLFLFNRKQFDDLIWEEIETDDQQEADRISEKFIDLVENLSAGAWRTGKNVTWPISSAPFIQDQLTVFFPENSELRG